MAKIGKTQEIPVEKLKPYEKNAKKHPKEQIDLIVRSIEEYGFLNPCLIDKDYNVIAGHGRIMAAKQMGMEKVPCLFVEGLTDAQYKAYVLADNKLTEMGEWDMDLVIDELHILEGMDFDISLTGFELPDETIDDDSAERVALVDRFGAPPFSVLDTRQGYWQERKKAWKALGIKSELGRDAECLPTSIDEKYGRKVQNATSIFDPVLCELMYKWFCVDGGEIYDCFAGGSVRGIVAARLGYKYTGIDIRQEQVDANYENASDIGVEPVWYCDDSANVDKYLDDESVDMIFSCPPYGDLEVYSDNPADISNMDYQDFCKAYKAIIDKACKKLKKDRFAVFVVGDIRDENGAYRNFVDYTKECFNKNGLVTYNEAILLDMLGTAMIRASQTFKTRKLVKVHQNVLCFYKGDIKNIKDNFAEIEIENLE